MASVRAAVVREAKGLFSLEDLELDELRPNEVRVRLVAVGTCHTDVAMRDGVYPIPMPVVLGHEGAASSKPSAATSPESVSATTW